MEMKATVTGTSEAVEYVRSYGDKLDKAVINQLEISLQKILDRSNELVPVDKGYLLASGRIEILIESSGDITGIVIYGNEMAPYALWVHEMTETAHAPPTQAKFLETAYDELLDEILDEMALAVKGV